jgi:hypothetical protein
MYTKNETSLGAINGIVNTESQVSLTEHRAKTVLLSLPRTAFLALLRLNVWGMATLLSKRAFLVDEATTARQSVPYMWWDLQADWRNAWWNLGGSWDSFVGAVNAGKTKKFLAIKLAPKKIRQLLEDQGIGSTSTLLNKGIGAVAEATTIATASAIIIAVTPLIQILLTNIKKDVPITDLQTFDSFNADDTLPPKDGMQAGVGLIGAAVLAALYFGTQKKGK